MWTTFEVARISEAQDKSSAYDHLSQVLAGTLPLFMMHRAHQRGFDIWSEEAKSMLSSAGFIPPRRCAIRKVGEGSDQKDLKLHTDGFINGALINNVHHHETTEGEVEGLFIRTRRNRVSNRYVYHPWDEYIKMEEGLVDVDFLEPKVYREILVEGTVVVFAVSGVNAILHQFTSLQNSVNDRAAAISFIDRANM